MESHKSSTSWIFSETGSCFRSSKVVSIALFVSWMFPGSKFFKKWRLLEATRRAKERARLSHFCELTRMKPIRKISV
jgi:hypothetical protein